MFPFHYENKKAKEYQPNNETSYDCVYVSDWSRKYYCPTAIHRDSKMIYGVPYMWACPEMEEHELQPSCFKFPENGKLQELLIFIYCDKEICLEYVYQFWIFF